MFTVISRATIEKTTQRYSKKKKPQDKMEYQKNFLNVLITQKLEGKEIRNNKENEQQKINNSGLNSNTEIVKSI